MTIDQQILGMTTIINSTSSTFNYLSQGTGFFYSELSEDDKIEDIPNKPTLRKVESVWLITNRHVAFPIVSLPDGSENETVPDSFEFKLRIVDNSNIEWESIILKKDDLLARTKLHSNPSIDVVAIQIGDLISNFAISNKGRRIINPLNLTQYNFPDHTKVKIEATSDVIICSYPYGFYDDVNKFPIIKSGIIASSWGSLFKGLPYFLVDTKLFPGSSGGLVLIKPEDKTIVEGKKISFSEKKIVILGIYSGEYNHTIIDSNGKVITEPFGLGIVWYSYLIQQIISNGSSYQHN